MACRLKICGVTRPEDVDLCCELGVDAIGFNLWPGSPRGLTFAAAALLLQRVPASGPARIGVVVDPSADEMRSFATLTLDAIQLHGTRTIAEFPPLGMPHVHVIRGTPALAELRIPDPAPQWILLDAAVPGFGGHGVKHDWAWAAAAREALAPAAVWLAGGLDPRNAAEAIAIVRPFGIDVASGAEDAGPGRKSRALIAALRAICDTVTP